MSKRKRSPSNTAEEPMFDALELLKLRMMGCDLMCWPESWGSADGKDWWVLPISGIGLESLQIVWPENQGGPTKIVEAEWDYCFSDCFHDLEMAASSDELTRMRHYRAEMRAKTIRGTSRH